MSISLLLHETKNKMQGQMLIIMIPYECLWCNRLISHCLWSQTDHNYLTLKICLIKTCLKYIIDFDNTCLGVNNTSNVSQCNNCTFNQVYELYGVSRQKFHILQLYSREKYWQIWKLIRQCFTYPLFLQGKVFTNIFPTL